MEYLSNVILIICLNSFLVLLHNLIESYEIQKKSIKNLNLKDQLILSSIFFSSIFFILDNLILILINKEKIMIEILIIVIILIMLWINKIKNLEMFFKANHILFDIFFILKPFIYYIIFITIKNGKLV
jgi:hypothetical protein